MDVMDEIVRRYFGGNAFSALVHEQRRHHGATYASDMAGPRDWLARFGLNPWTEETPARTHPCYERP
jgi:hypothetical protein